MNIYQERTLSMYEAIIFLLDNNIIKTSDLINFAPLFSNFKIAVQNIKMLQGKQRNLQSSAQGQAKIDARIALILKTRKLINAIKAYNDDMQTTSNAVILLATTTYFNRLKDTNLVSDCRSLYNMGMNVASALEIYTIPVGWLVDYKVSIDTFEHNIPVPRLSKTELASYTAQLLQLFIHAKQQLEKVSKKIALLEFDDATFYQQYKTIKRVTNAQSKALAFKANFVDINNTNLKRFTVTLTRQSDNKISIYKTNKNNTIQRRNLATGIYTIDISALDILNFTGRLVLDAGFTCAIRVEIDMAAKSIIKVVKTDSGVEV
jgi:hypothetical protein